MAEALTGRRSAPAEVSVPSATPVDSWSRAGEALVWLLVLVGAFNFAPALFRDTNLSTQPAIEKLLKDVPLMLLLGWALLFGLCTGPGRTLRRAPTRSGLRGWDLRLAGSLVVLGAFMLGGLLILQPLAGGFAVSLRYYVLYPALVFAVALAMSRAVQRRRLFLLIGALGGMQALVAISEFVGLQGETYYSDYVTIAGGGFGRSIGTLGNPNNLGIFLGLPILLLLAGAAQHGPLRWILVALAMTGLVLTFSKAAGVALAVGAIVLLLGRTSTTRRARSAGVAAIALAGAAGFGVAIAGRFGGELSAFSILGNRMTSFDAALETWTSGPGRFVFGGGYGSQFASAGPAGVDQVLTDNMVLTLALEGGVLGILLFLATLVCGLAILLLAHRVARSRQTLALNAFAVFFLPYLLILESFRLFPAAMLFWLAVGLARAAALERQPATA